MPCRYVGAQVVGHRAEAVARAVGQDGVDGAHVVGHQPIADGFRAAGVVAGHAADGAAGVGRWIDREEQLFAPQRGVELAEHHAGFHQRRVLLRIDVQDAAQVLAAVQHQRAIHRLAALAGAAAARQHRHAVFARDRQGGGHVVDGFRDHHAERLDLVDRGVGGIAAAIGGIEQHRAADVAAQALGQAGVAGGDHAPRIWASGLLPLPLREGVGGRGPGRLPGDRPIAPSPQPPPARGGGGV